MLDQEERSAERQNTKLQEATFSNAVDTAGFLYAPYRVEFDKKSATLQLTDNTLRDIIKNDLLSRSIVWLLGYDARLSLEDQIGDVPIRAQAQSSHWETAWSVIHFIDSLPILDQSHPAIAKEIKRRLGSENIVISPLAWLLSEANDLGNGLVYWYGKQYDTALVTLALLRARSQNGIELSSQQRVRLDQVLQGALNWLYSGLKQTLETGKIDEEAIEVLEPLIVAEAYAPSLLSNIQLSDHGPQHFYEALGDWLSYLEASYISDDKGRNKQATDKSDIQYGFGADVAYCLSTLVLTTQSADLEVRNRLQPFAERARTLLLIYIEFLEERIALGLDQWGGNLNRIWRLGTYAQACRSVTLGLESSKRDSHITNPTNPEVVLKVLSAVKNDLFSNGSIFHSVYATLYFARSLIDIWNWPDSRKTVARLYHDLLDKFVTGVSVERKENLELRRLLIAYDHRLADEKAGYRGLLVRERKKRYALLGTVWFSLILVVLIYASYNLKLSDLIQFTGVAIGLLTILLLIVEVLFLRES